MLAEYPDFTIAPYGDAVINLEGLGEKFWPASGMGAVFVAWPLIMMTVEKLIERGIYPNVLRSLNIPGGSEENTQAVKRYEELGYWQTKKSVKG
jgi:uncharacterized phosphosugar-binding protein